MATAPVSFNPYLGWVNVTDPANIPPGTRKITAAELLRYENGIKDAVARVNTHTLFVDGVGVAVASAWTVRALASTTAARPSAVTLKAGAMIYDSTLKKPLWSDGTVWRDATGAAV